MVRFRATSCPSSASFSLRTFAVRPSPMALQGRRRHAQRGGDGRNAELEFLASQGASRPVVHRQGPPVAGVVPHRVQEHFAFVAVGFGDAFDLAVRAVFQAVLLAAVEAVDHPLAGRVDHVWREHGSRLVRRAEHGHMMRVHLGPRVQVEIEHQFTQFQLDRLHFLSRACLALCLSRM